MTHCGVLNIDKPLRMTSHDVVARVRRTLGVQKVGHSGTLDPLATGVLLMCVGPAARMSEFLMASTKTYIADVYLGRETTTDDGEGSVLSETDASGLTAERISDSFQPFTGEIDQLPPAYSAIKQGGRKLYELARKGQAIKAEPRRVRIDSIRLLEWTPPIARIEVVCGSGTYIRSLARDIGRALGVGGSLAGLRRTMSGNFSADDGLPESALSNPEALVAGLIPLRSALSGWPEVALDEAELLAVRLGKRIPDVSLLATGALALGISPSGDVVALLRATPEGWQPDRVLMP